MPSPNPHPNPAPGRSGHPRNVLRPLLWLCLALLPAAPALGMGPRPDALPRFAGDPRSTVYESYSTAREGRLTSYTLVLQFAGCPGGATFELELDADRPALFLPDAEQLDRDETCQRLTDLARGKTGEVLRGAIGGCERGGLAFTAPVDCPEGCSPPEFRLTHDCARGEVWVAGQPEIMDGEPAPRELGWIGGARHTLAGFRFSALRPGPLRIELDTDQDPELKVLAVHFVSDPEAGHTARVESLGAEGSVYSAMVHTPGEYELILLLGGEEPLTRVAGRVVPATPLAPAPLDSDYAAACVPEGAVTGPDGAFSFAVDDCAGAWGRRNGLCSPRDTEDIGK